MIDISFLYAGKAYFTVSSNRDGSTRHYTFRVLSGKRGWAASQRFVSVMTGSDNINSYSYYGILRSDGKIKTTSNSKINHKDKSAKVFRYAVSVILGERKIPDGWEIESSGRCGKCGRQLTTPDSLTSGFGPVCSGRV